MLDSEIAAFEACLPDMLASHRGAYAVFQGGEPRQYLPTYEQAVEWAYEHLGLGCFLIRQVNETAPSLNFTRPLAA